MFEKRRNCSYDYGDNGNYNQRCLKSTERKKPKGEFVDFFFSLMKQSLITGFPVIANSKSSLRKTVKVLVFLICTAGFFYQTRSFLDMYLEYPTVQDISIQHPEKIEAPAFTICNRNRLWRQPYCEGLPHHCEFYHNESSDFCKDYPLYCPSTEPRNRVFGYVDSYFYKNSNRTKGVLDAYGPQKENDLISSCDIKGFGEVVGRPCGSAIHIQAASNGLPYKCFSLLSLLGAPDHEPAKLITSDEYAITLNLHPEEYVKPTDLIQAYFHIHDPRSVTNPTAEGVTLTAGYKYRLYVTMVKKESLPPPYKSNCMDYLTMWRKNGGYGPITKRGCTDWCKIQAMVKEYGCVAQSFTYPNNFTICSDHEIVTSDEVNAKCAASCNVACNSSDYTMTSEIVDDIGKLLLCDDNDLHCRNKNIMVYVSFSRMNIEKFKRIPKFQSVELFSYIGGYMGLWLGISLVSLFDFIEMLFNVLAYPVIKYKRNRKKFNEVERMQRNITHNVYDI